MILTATPTPTLGKGRNSEVEYCGRILIAAYFRKPQDRQVTDSKEKNFGDILDETNFLDETNYIQNEPVYCDKQLKRLEGLSHSTLPTQVHWPVDI